MLNQILGTFLQYEVVANHNKREVHNPVRLKAIKRQIMGDNTPDETSNTGTIWNIVLN
jgi:hypothetical protein